MASLATFLVFSISSFVAPDCFSFLIPLIQAFLSLIGSKILFFSVPFFESPASLATNLFIGFLSFSTCPISCDVNDLTYKVLYAHLYPNSAKVRTNDNVTKGQLIASVGTTGYSTGNHLHYQVSLDGKVVDGMSLIDFTYENSEIEKPPFSPYEPMYN